MPTPPEQLQLLAAAIRASPHNLVSRRDRDLLEERHIPECVAFARELPDRGRLVDIGSGGGLPGLVIAIERPDLEVHLVEATRKKAVFLREIADHLSLEHVTVHNDRAEELVSTDLAGTFDLATARAVARLDRLIPWVAPFLRRKGVLHAIKGEHWSDELREAQEALHRANLEVVHTPDSRPMTPPHPLVVMLRRL